MEEMRQCLCGCGGTIAPATIKRHRTTRYLLGHQKRKNPPLSREELVELHVNQQLNCRKIANLYGVTIEQVYGWLRLRDIKRMDLATSNRIEGKGISLCPERDVLSDLYHRQQKQPREIAELYGVARNTVRGWLRRLDIQTRTYSEAKLLSNALPKPSDDELRRMYVNEEMCGSDIARTMDVDIGTALKWLRNAGIQIRSLSETQAIVAKKKGRKASTRQSYLSPRLRYHVLSRDAFRCTACGRSPRIHGVVLHVDHIHPRSKGGSNESGNLQSLCADCNLGKSDTAPFQVSTDS